jgi:ElaB/YqjD/DUF883 family membrane-anchored ribosome-binding protein
MAERLYSSSGVPDYSTYPEEPATAAPNVEAKTLEATYASYRRYSEAELEPESALSHVAARFGNVLGNAVSRVRDAVGQARSRMSSGVTAAGESTTMTTRDWQTRARQFAHEEPLKVILAAGALGLMVGAGIRMGRSHE